MSTIILEGDYAVEGRRVTLTNEQRQAVYMLPNRARRVVVEKAGRGRSRLIIGGFTKVTVSVTGPNDVIEQLKEAVLT